MAARRGDPAGRVLLTMGWGWPIGARWSASIISGCRRRSEPGCKRQSFTSNRISAMPSIPRHALAACALAVAVLVAGCSGGEEAGLARAKNALATKDSKLALVELKSFLQKHPKSAEGRMLLAQLLVQGSEFSAAVAEYQRALDNGMAPAKVLPAMARAMVKGGELGQVVSKFKDEQLADPLAQASLGASLAMALAAQGDLRGANEVNGRGLAAAPTSVPARLMKARLDAVMGRVDAGLKQIDAVLVEQPADAEAWATKGDFMLQVAGGRAAAAEAFETALKIQPSDVHVLSSVVPVYLALGRTDEARRAVDRLRKLAPQHFATARSDAALAYATGDHARAREIYQALLKALPDQVPLLLQAGENELRLGAPTQAEAMFAKASALQPSNPVARRLLAQAQLQLGQVPKALLTLEPLVEAPDASAAVLAMAAEARKRNGEVSAAEALYTRLAKLKPADPRLQTVVATAGFGRASDDAVFNELRQIASRDKGSSADMALVNAHIQRGQADAALQALAAIDAKLPAEPGRHMLRGQILASKQDWAGARQAFEAALAMDDDNMTALSALAALDMKESKPEAAVQRFRALLKTQPGNAGAMLGLAEVIERQDDNAAEALKLRNGAVKAASGSPDAHIALINHHMKRRDHDAALNAALAATTAMPNNLDLLELLGRNQVAKQQTSQALSSFGKIAAMTPKSPRGHVLAAALHFRIGDNEAAQRSIERALRLDPASAEALSLAASLAVRKKQPEKALEVAHSAQQLRPTDALGWMLEGEIEFGRSHWARAAAAYRKALDKPPAETAARRLYVSLVRADKGAEAAAFAAQWQKGHPRDADFLSHMGDVARARGQLTEASKFFEQTLALAPSHALALNNLAMLRLQAKHPGALELAQRAAKAAPFEPAVLDTLAQALATEDKLGEAVRAQSRAVQLAPEEPEFRLVLTRLLIQSGEKAKAKVELDKLRELGAQPKDQEEMERLTKLLVRG